MSAPATFALVPFDSEEAWPAFDLDHGVMHSREQEAILAMGIDVDLPPMYDFPRRDNVAYLIDHWQVHRAISVALGGLTVPDISQADFNDPAQFDDWMQAHAQLHVAELARLGLT